MTRNQIAYNQLLEDIRKNNLTNAHNIRSHQETVRSNLAREAETKRHNVVGEQHDFQSLAETKRSNVAREKETLRSNVARETETSRSNRAVESETRRSNQAREAETHRSNVARETIDKTRNEFDRILTLLKINKDYEVRKAALELEEARNAWEQGVQTDRNVWQRNQAMEELRLAWERLDFDRSYGSWKTFTSLVDSVLPG